MFRNKFFMHQSYYAFRIFKLEWSMQRKCAMSCYLNLKSHSRKERDLHCKSLKIRSVFHVTRKKVTYICETFKFFSTIVLYSQIIKYKNYKKIVASQLISILDQNGLEISNLGTTFLADHAQKNS